MKYYFDLCVTDEAIKAESENLQASSKFCFEIFIRKKKKAFFLVKSCNQNSLHYGGADKTAQQAECNRMKMEITIGILRLYLQLSLWPETLASA